MKKIITLIFAFITFVSLSSCGDGDTTSQEFTEEKQIINLVSSYTIEETNGFDYSLEQKMKDSNNTVVNSHKIVVRVDKSNETIGSKEEYKKSLNEDISKGQYTEESSITYYKNNKAAVNENGSWTWKNCQLNEFAAISIDSFSFDVNKLKNIKLSQSGKFYILSFSIDDKDASDFLGINNSISGLSFDIKANADKNKLVYFKMNYSQELTSTSFAFTPYYGTVNINLPL